MIIKSRKLISSLLPSSLQSGSLPDDIVAVLSHYTDYLDLRLNFIIFQHLCYHLDSLSPPTYVLSATHLGTSVQVTI
jgi:hypothetical protein